MSDEIIDLVEATNYKAYHGHSRGDEYFFPRHSSKSRILINTSIMGTSTLCFGFGRAIYTGQSQLKIGSKYLIAGLGLGLLHQVSNEIFTGILIRKGQQEQYAYTNLGASVVTMGAGVGLTAVLRRGINYTQLKNVQIFVGSLACTAMLLEFYALTSRRSILGKTQNFIRFENT